MPNNRGRLSSDNWSAASVHDMNLFNDVFSTSPMPYITNSTQGMGENIGRLGSLCVLCEMSVIVVFPLKKGNRGIRCAMSSH